MPFGSFMAQSRDPQPEKKRREKAPAPPTPPVEETPHFSEINVNSLKLRILLLCRTLPAAQEFLCSMTENMSRELHRDALTYYTTELGAISDITDRKKKLERFFWECSKSPWTLLPSTETSKTYTFSISPSGMQTKALDLVFHCVSYEAAASVSLAEADAVWYLADGPVLDSAVGYDPYREFLSDALRNLPRGEGDTEKPACLLLSQIETYGHFEGSGELSLLAPDVHQKLIRRCEELFASGKGSKLALIPVQIYGGLEYTGTDDGANAVLRISRSGYYQSYIPENCQTPALYTIDRIAAAREMDFFADAPGGGMRRIIHRHFVRKTGTVDWKADLLGEVENQ